MTLLAPVGEHRGSRPPSRPLHGEQLQCSGSSLSHSDEFSGCNITWYEGSSVYTVGADLVVRLYIVRSIVTRGKVWADYSPGQLKERANPPARVWSTGVLSTQRLARLWSIRYSTRRLVVM